MIWKNIYDRDFQMYVDIFYRFIYGNYTPKRLEQPIDFPYSTDKM